MRAVLKRSRQAIARFTPAELRKLRAMRTPAGVQRYLDSIPYHLPISSRSPRIVLRTGSAHCLEGATFAAAALRVLGFPPLILDLEADRDTDHVIAVFKMRGHWGAVAKSNFSGLPLSRAGLSHVARAGPELLPDLLQPARRAHAASLFATGESGAFRSSRLDDLGGSRSGSSPNIFATSRIRLCSSVGWRNTSRGSMRVRWPVR